METTETFDFKTFGELFEEIAFDFEAKYEPEIYDRGEVRYIAVYKTSFSSDGKVNRKGHEYAFDPKLFWKVELMIKLLQNDSTLEVLYGSK